MVQHGSEYPLWAYAPFRAVSVIVQKCSFCSAFATNGLTDLSGLSGRQWLLIRKKLGIHGQITGSGTAPAAGSAEIFLACQPFIPQRPRSSAACFEDLLDRVIFQRVLTFTLEWHEACHPLP
jgi:hypothetical protein